jgi:hypothetical protein
MKFASIIFALITLSVTAMASGGESFICSGKDLYSTSRFLTTFADARGCQAAVALSKNTFICNGADLYSTDMYISKFSDIDACQAAVNASK